MTKVCLFRLEAKENMSALGNLKKYTSELPQVAALGLGVVGAQVAWGFVSPMIPAAVQVHAAVQPALQLAAGVLVFVAAAKSGNKYVKWAGTGAAASLAAGGVMGIASAFGVIGGSTATGSFYGAPVDVQEVAGFAGAPVTVEEVAGLSAVGATIY